MDSKPAVTHIGDVEAGAPRTTSRLFEVTQAGSRHRGDTIEAQEVGSILTKVAVVLLSSVNAVLWQVYTEAPFMAAAWAAIAIAFVIWIVREARKR